MSIVFITEYQSPFCVILLNNMVGFYSLVSQSVGVGLVFIFNCVVCDAKVFDLYIINIVERSTPISRQPESLSNGYSLPCKVDLSFVPLF